MEYPFWIIVKIIYNDVLFCDWMMQLFLKPFVCFFNHHTVQIIEGHIFIQCHRNLNYLRISTDYITSVIILVRLCTTFHFLPSDTRSSDFFVVTGFISQSPLCHWVLSVAVHKLPWGWALTSRSWCRTLWICFPTSCSQYCMYYQTQLLSKVPEIILQAIILEFYMCCYYPNLWHLESRAWKWKHKIYFLLTSARSSFTQIMEINSPFHS